jgi:hypothetical protein
MPDVGWPTSANTGQHPFRVWPSPASLDQTAGMTPFEKMMMKTQISGYQLIADFIAEQQERDPDVTVDGLEFLAEQERKKLQTRLDLEGPDRQ